MVPFPERLPLRQKRRSASRGRIHHGNQPLRGLRSVRDGLREPGYQ